MVVPKKNFVVTS